MFYSCWRFFAINRWCVLWDLKILILRFCLFLERILICSLGWARTPCVSGWLWIQHLLDCSYAWVAVGYSYSLLGDAMVQMCPLNSSVETSQCASTEDCFFFFFCERVVKLCGWRPNVMNEVRILLKTLREMRQDRATVLFFFFLFAIYHFSMWEHIRVTISTKM